MASGIAPRVYLDACIYLKWIKKEDGWPLALKLLLASASGEITVVASTLLLAEVCGYNGSVEDPKRQRSVADEYLEDNDRIEWVEVDRFVTRQAREFSSHLRLRGADAVHLATAARSRCNYFMSHDHRYPYGRRIGPTMVSEPRVVWSETLDDLQVDKVAEQEGQGSDED